MPSVLRHVYSELRVSVMVWGEVVDSHERWSSGPGVYDFFPSQVVTERCHVPHGQGCEGIDIMLVVSQQVCKHG